MNDYAISFRQQGLPNVWKYVPKNSHDRMYIIVKGWRGLCLFYILIPHSKFIVNRFSTYFHK